jgi:hypothetical protein
MMLLFAVILLPPSMHSMPPADGMSTAAWPLHRVQGTICWVMMQYTSTAIS